MSAAEKAGLGLIGAACLIVSAVLGAVVVAVLSEQDSQGGGRVWARSASR